LLAAREHLAGEADATLADEDSWAGDEQAGLALRAAAKRAVADVACLFPLAPAAAPARLFDDLMDTLMAETERGGDLA